MTEVEERILRVPSCRASIELQGRRPLTLAEEGRFRAAIPDVGLAGTLYLIYRILMALSQLSLF